MKVTILAVIFCCLCSFSVLAQTSYSIKGAIVDSAENVKLANTTITVINAKDSIMRAFTWAVADGSFSINKLPKGKFLLLVTYPGYADYVEDFSLDAANSQHDFGRLNMILKSRLLTEVIIKGQVTAIKIKGDTTEFNAKAYKIQPNDKVEDLLRQLPGIQVDKDGKITAQGQTVNKVLVDGEEFFGDDPTLVTKNIRADMVDKVQVYDKKSDQAAFTGIDDGVKTKTINIKLLEDKKNGYFGKAAAGLGTNGYYEGQLLFNRFKAKEKFSAYGTLGNDGKIGLGYEDNRKYTDAANYYFGGSDEQYFNIPGSRDDLDSYEGRYDGNGIPVARSGGVHYDNKWNSDKESINTNYKTGSLQVDGASENISQNNLPGGFIYNDSRQNFHKFMFKQKLDATYQVKLDTTSNLKIGIDGTVRHSTLLLIDTATGKKNDTIINNRTRHLTNNVDEKILNANLFYTKKFKKIGRTLSLQVNEAVNQSEAKGYLNSEIDYYTKDKLDSIAKVNQYKTNTTNTSVLHTNLTYTEPLSRKLSLILNYGLGIDNGRSDRKTYDTTPGIPATARPNYTILDSAYSNNYKLNQLSNSAGAMFSYKKGKGILNFGTRITDVSFKQFDVYADTTLKRHFVNWQPQATYQYRFSQQESLYINYSGNVTQPTIDQIQPVQVNNDPLNIFVGNPGLKPSFSNNFYFSYNSYKVLKEQNIYFNGGYTFTTNPIVNNNVTDAAGKTTYQAVNVNKTNANFYFSGSMGRRIKPSDIYIGLSLYANGNTSYNYSNHEINKTNAYNYSVRLELQKYKVKKYNVNISFGPGYTINESSLQQNVNNNGKSYSGYANLGFYLPGKLQITSNANYQFTAKTASFDQDFSKLIINTALIKSFFKDENLRLSLSANDLLNQNLGFSRGAYGSAIVQNTNTTIKRYFMLSLTWDFNKFGHVKQENK